jgi:hypothetical protein
MSSSPSTNLRRTSTTGVRGLPIGDGDQDDDEEPEP